MKPYNSVFHAYTWQMGPVICFFEQRSLDEVSNRIPPTSQSRPGAIAAGAPLRRRCKRPRLEPGEGAAPSSILKMHVLYMLVYKRNSCMYKHEKKNILVWATSNYGRRPGRGRGPWPVAFGQPRRACAGGCKGRSSRIIDKIVVVDSWISPRSSLGRGYFSRLSVRGLTALFSGSPRVSGRPASCEGGVRMHRGRPPERQPVCVYTYIYI